MTNDTTNDTTTDLVNEHTSLHLSGAAVMNDHERRLNLLESSLDKVLSILTPKDEGQEPDDGMTDSEADADALASAGFGTDEDYGGSDDRL